MKTHIALGAGLLLTLGTAVAGTIFYGQSGQSQSARDESGQYATMSEQYSSSQSVRYAEIAQPAASTNDSSPTPEQIALWKATAASIDSITPKAPI